MDVRNIAQVLVAKDNTASIATTQIWDKEAATYVAVGQIAVTDEAGTLLTNATANDTSIENVVLRGRTNTSLLKSAPIKGDSVRSWLVEPYTAATEEVWTIGGPAEVFADDLSADVNFEIRIVRKDDALFNIPERYKRVSFSSTSTTTQEEVVNELVRRLDESFNRSTVRQGNVEDLDLRVERVSDGTITAADLPNNVIATNGSKYLTTTGAVTANLTAGTYIALTRTDAAGNSIDSIYQLAEDATATTLVLDIPYQGPSETITGANAGSVTAGTNWGIHIEGKPLLFEPGKFRYEKSRFDVETFNISSTLTQVQSADRGVGTYEEVAEHEWEGIGFFGDHYLVGTPENSRNLVSDSTCTYDRVSINWDNKTVDNVLGSVNHTGNATIYVPVGAAQADDATYGFVTVLDAYIVTAFGKGSAQVGNLTP